jgi:hypothetical protein
LLAHQGSKWLKWQKGLLPSFDGNLLEKPSALPENEDLYRSTCAVPPIPFFSGQCCSSDMTAW